MIRLVIGGTNSFKRTPVLGNFKRSQRAGTGRKKTHFVGRELKENHAEMQNTLMEEKDNRFRSLGGGHTALLSYHSHRGFFKALNCGKFALIF